MTSISNAAGAGPMVAVVETTVEKEAYRKATARLLPFLLICYTFAYLDRINIGFAKLSMLKELGLSETVFGLGASIFFAGYFLFEIPGALIAEPRMRSSDQRSSMSRSFGSTPSMSPIMIIGSGAATSWTKSKLPLAPA